MNPSYCLSSSRNTITSEAFLLHPKHRVVLSLFSSTETHFPKKEATNFLKPQIPQLPKCSFLPILRLNNSKLPHPFALSSFADAEGEEPQQQQTDVKANQQGHETSEDQSESRGMAEAFNVSSRTATAISICIAFAALTLPYFMKSLGQGLPLKTKLLSYGTLIFGFYMAWNIGANDVANAMGTSVGSGALTIRQAVLTAAVLEFSGAFLMGTHVTSTMQKGILAANAFQGKDTLLFAGLLASLAAAGTWLQVHINCS